MVDIIQIQGNVNFKITLDPTVWIFDDRRVDLTTYFKEERVIVNEEDAYVEGASKFWSREIMEGASFPPTLKTEKKFERQQMKTGTFGIVIEPFIKNAEPTADAQSITFIDGSDNEYTFPLEEGKQVIFKFSQDGKILSEDGPIHLIYADGSNAEDPIKNIVGIRID